MLRQLEGVFDQSLVARKALTDESTGKFIHNIRCSKAISDTEVLSVCVPWKESEVR